MDDGDDFNGSIRLSLINEVNSCTPVGSYGGPTSIGRLVVADKWRDTVLINELRKTIRVILTEESGIVDFRLQDGSVVVYMSESNLVLNPDIRRNLVKLRNMNNVKGVVIAELNNFSEEYYFKMQHFAVLDLGLTVFPVANQTEAALLLSEMVSVQSGMSSDPFRTKKAKSSAIDVVMSAIQTIPGLGEKKAKQLLEKFGSLKNISHATVDELVPIVGLCKANEVFKFFR